MGALDGRVALVTGAGTGIGRAIAEDLANAGAELIVCGRRKGPLDAAIAAIGKGSVITADLTEPADIERLAAQIITEHGGVDILINNAGFSSKVRSARHIGAEEWRAVMDVNTMGPALLTRALLPSMIERGQGDVVMISSVAGLRPNVMAGVVYSAAKAAARAYMDVLSQEVRADGVRCITVFPGEVDTPILDNRALPPDAENRALMMMPEDISAAVLMAVSLPRRATVMEMAIGATYPRDTSADIEAAKTKDSVDG
ncbi:MAG: NADP-dependent 3-hydroxy acid dehydrogenase YdfG [Gammaproteobacteria bacterium]|jgi:NADP-dependent 3-hydroxy acid dehydrogenase YdfG